MKELLYSFVIVSAVLLALFTISQLSTAQNKSEANTKTENESGLQKTRQTRTDLTDNLWSKIVHDGVWQAGLRNLTIPTASPLSQFTQQGPKLLGTGALGAAQQGTAVALSADGNTAIVGGPLDNFFAGGPGAAWIWTRSGGVWTQQGPKLVGSGTVGNAFQGISVSLSADGNTAIIGGYQDNFGIGAAWIWTRSGGVWTQQGSKLVGSGSVGNAAQGRTVALAADGNTAIVGGSSDGGGIGATWVWTRSGGVWTQQGPKLVGSGSVGIASQGGSVTLAAEGKTAIVGASSDSGGIGAAWVWTRSGGVWTQHGSKLVGSGALENASQGISVAISADGNTGIVGGFSPGGPGAAWVWTRSSGAWTQQGSKLVGSGALGNAGQGISVALSADGNTALVGGYGDRGGIGATWAWTRNDGTWTQQGSKLFGFDSVGGARQGVSASLSADANTAIVGGNLDNNDAGAAWVFTTGPATPTPTPMCQPIGSDVDRDGIDDFCDTSYNPTISAPTPNPGYGSKRILVAHLKFPELSSPPFDIENTRNRLIGVHPFSLTQFFSEISFGASQQTYDIRPWANLPNSRAFYQAADPSGESMASDAVNYVGTNYDLTGVDIIVLILTPIDLGYPGCSAYLPPGIPIGNSGRTLPVVRLSGNNFACLDSGTTSHEIGHAYGFLHTSRLACKTWPFAIPATFTDPYHSATDCGMFSGMPDAALFPYANYDFMGIFKGHPNAYQKWQAGWLTPAQIIEAPKGGLFILDSYEVASDGPKAVRVPYGADAEGKSVSWWIEYRTKPEVDLELQNVNSTTDRVFVWVNLPNVRDGNRLSDSSSFNFDTLSVGTPLQPYGMRLPVGGAFTDPYRGLRITRGADSTVGGIKRSSISVEVSDLKFEPSLGVKLGPTDTRDLVVTNSGARLVTLGQVTLKGRSASAFHIGMDTCSGTVLSNGAECRVSVNHQREAGDTDTKYAHVEWTTDDPLWPSPTVGVIGNPINNPVILPASPTIGTATGGNNSAIVSFTPRSIGSGSLVNYTATCTAGVPNTGASSPITVSGLTNGTASNCVVKATSTVGDSGWSAASNSVTPTPPLPIVTISGRVLTPGGLGLRNAVVTLTDTHGNRRTATTSSFGVYSLDNVQAGQTYVIGVSSKRYRFASQSLPVNGNLTNVDFIGLE